jgi:hypothetical protein
LKPYIRKKNKILRLKFANDCIGKDDVFLDKILSLDRSQYNIVMSIKECGEEKNRALYWKNISATYLFSLKKYWIKRGIS